MMTVTHFTMEPTAFSLGVVFERIPGARVTLERVVPTGNGVVPYIWVEDADLPEAREALSEMPGVASVTLVDRMNDQYLLRSRLSGETDPLLTLIGEMDVTLLSGEGTADGWSFQVRTPDGATISTFRERCADQSIPVAITAIQPLSAGQDPDGFGLTPSQREALLAAYRQGYFDEPRQATLEEIASDLDISRQALSSRLRRAYRRLVERTVVEG